MPVRMIAIDLDYTLLDSAHRVPPANAAAVADAAGRGIRVVLASARPPRSMRRYHEELGLATPVLAYNGALIYDLAESRTLRHQAIPISVARAAVAFLRSLRPAPNLSLECEGLWHIDRYDDELRRVVAEYDIEPPHGVGTVERVLADQTAAVTKILFTGGHLEDAELAGLERRLGPELCLVRTSDRLVEIMAAGVSKAEGMAWLAGRWGIPRAETMAIGDHHNDIAMLQWAGIGVAMGNAPDAVRRAADAVTGTHDEAGVAAAIRRYAG